MSASSRFPLTPVFTLCALTSLSSLALGQSASPLGKVVFIGDSLMAGYQNGSLLDSQQLHGVAPLLARQMGFSLTLPLIAAPGFPSVLELAPGQFPPLAQSPGLTIGRDDYFAQPTDLAVPGQTLHDILLSGPTLDLSTTDNILTDLVLAFPLGNTLPQLEEAIALKPTAVVVWAGSTDALVADEQGDPAAMTPVATFATEYGEIIGALKTYSSAQLVVATIPDVTAIPYMSPASTVLAVLSSETSLPVSTLEYVLGIQPGDLVNAQGLEDLATDVGMIKAGRLPGALPGGDVLTAAEITQVQGTIAGYNQVIAQAASAAGATLVDVHGLFSSLLAGTTKATYVDAAGVSYTATNAYLGGLFGLDGIHPTNTGYALVANTFISALNARYGVNIAPVNVASVAVTDPLFGLSLSTLLRQSTIPAAAAKQAGQMLRREAGTR